MARRERIRSGYGDMGMALPGRTATPSAGQRFRIKAAPFEGDTVAPLSAACLNGS